MTSSSSAPLVRQLSPQEQPSIYGLLQEVHQRQTLDDYPMEYPLVFGGSTDGFSVAARQTEATAWQAHVGVLRRFLRFNAMRLPVALIGSVATLPSARRWGLASCALQQAHQLLKAEGFALAFLWSESRPLYRALGYHPVGRLYAYALPELPLQPPGAFSVQRVESPLGSVMPPPVLEDWASLERSPQEHQRLLQLPGLECWQLTDAQQQQAGVLVAKGSDLPDLLHEWSGPPALLLSLVAEVRRRRGKLGILLPHTQGGLAGWMHAQGFPGAEFPQAQAVILDRTRLLEQLAAAGYATQVRGLERTLAAFPPQAWDRQLLHQLFGLADEPDVGHALLPLHFWGLDCI